MYFENVHRNVKYCGLCGSENIKLNRASTSFCFDCHYDITRGGFVSRMVTHPLSLKYGWRIKKLDPDFEQLSNMRVQ